MKKQSLSIFEAMRELSTKMVEMQEAWLNFLEKQDKAREAADNFKSILDDIQKKPNIEIKDYEIDG